MNTINTLIVDDKTLARKRIRRLLEKEKDISIVGECKNGKEAVNFLSKNSIDLIFLDVQMPELNGFGVLKKLRSIPITIFVTAYDKYALKAFEVHAVDYLLKPFDDERFYHALNHAREQITSSQGISVKDKIFKLLAELAGSKSHEKSLDSSYLDRIVIKSAGRIYFLQTKEIVRIKAAGKYLEIFAGNQEHKLRQTMNEMESKLNPDLFIRIHRSTFINIDEIKEIQHWYKTEYIFFMNNGEKFTSSSTYSKNLKSIINKFS